MSISRKQVVILLAIILIVILAFSIVRVMQPILQIRAPSAGAPASVTIKGMNVMLDDLYHAPNTPTPKDYQPNGWTSLKNIGVNAIIVGYGPEGDVPL